MANKLLIKVFKKAQTIFPDFLLFLAPPTPVRPVPGGYIPVSVRTGVPSLFCFIWLKARPRGYLKKLILLY